MFLEVLFRQASTCQSASLSSPVLEQTLEQKKADRDAFKTMPLWTLLFALSCLHTHTLISFPLIVLWNNTVATQCARKYTLHFIVPGLGDMILEFVWHGWMPQNRHVLITFLYGIKVVIVLIWKMLTKVIPTN